MQPEKVTVYVDLIDSAWYALFDEFGRDTGVIAQWSGEAFAFIDEDRRAHMLGGIGSYAVRQA